MPTTFRRLAGQLFGHAALVPIEPIAADAARPPARRGIPDEYLERYPAEADRAARPPAIGDLPPRGCRASGRIGLSCPVWCRPGARCPAPGRRIDRPGAGPRRGTGGVPT